ncbi:helix-turn-helix domain-containing protein [Bifidobacterium vespertilionis]|uniref:helix-turn-helix domain-containing protein n=1 Tax=Bifidobacterium vespertilionis TaxID=2562524 RepID=UPI001BDDAD18|nr:helix-turn-helix domain-containing protein [Bifidobacterium vespertilionis]MBT1178611.1 helix-turn-helix domain-containing protein [Bifidobacterium vespertilionis]
MNNTTDICERPNCNTATKGLQALKAATEWLDLKDTRVTKRLVRDGKLKAIKIGNRIYITTESLNAFVGR